MAGNNGSTWAADVKNTSGRIDPNVLPEYTLLPSSPSQSAVSYNELGAETQASSSASNAHAHAHTSAPDPISGAEPPPSTLRLLYIGLLAIIAPPLVIFWVSLAAAVGMLYGCGKILEAVGRGLAFGPEALYRGWMGMRGKEWWRVVPVSDRRPVQEGAQEGVVEGQVSLEDVEAGQAISGRGREPSGW
ncbi:hypothetical protein LXA43DRAFT_1072296 [Ganoderma leucocontextum]|nr:hypothetical protein LXA43DRAFT_1072296 [Ganoderma leucocontextum]